MLHNVTSKMLALFGGLLFALAVSGANLFAIQERDLTDRECSLIVGGQIANRACATIPACATSFYNCASYTSDFDCFGQNQTDRIKSANDEGCIKVQSGKKCGEGTPQVDCSEVYTCAWDEVTLECYSLSTPSQVNRAPASCADENDPGGGA